MTATEQANPQPDDAPSPAPRARILVAEDDALLRNLVCMSLKATGYEVVEAEDGKQALEVFDREPVDLVILDVMMPHLDGFCVLQEIRRRSDVPVVMLTALGRTENIVQGFQLGADDYIPKPFTFKEVEARVEAILRRVEWSRGRHISSVIEYNGVRIDADAREAEVDGQPVHLTPIEFDLLYYLMSHPDQAVGKETLFHEVWGYDFSGGSNLVEVAIRRLRAKVERDPSHPERIVTVRGVGYKFNTGNDD